MITKRIIPCLDVKDGRVVKGVNFEGIKEVGDPVECAVAYDRLALMAVSVFHLAHWRADVTVKNYMQ